MISAKNYAANAERDLVEFLTKYKNHPGMTASTLNNVITAIEYIRGGIHFAAPDGGKIMDDNLKGLVGLPARLPFPTITLEYFDPSDKTANLVIAKELSHEAADVYMHPDMNKYESYILVFNATKYLEKWYLNPLCLFLPSQWDIMKNEGFDDTPISGSEAFVAFTTVLLDWFYDKANEKYIESMEADLSYSVKVLMEVLEALSCSNVSTEIINEHECKKNAKRVLQGKLPIYETRILSVNTSKKKGVSSGFMTGRTSPREHLRRGHIRRLESKNVWVQSCVVGNVGKGKIEKTYELH